MLEPNLFHLPRTRGLISNSKKQFILNISVQYSSIKMVNKFWKQHERQIHQIAKA